jgi:uncharacterized Zn-finger protein
MSDRRSAIWQLLSTRFAHLLEVGCTKRFADSSSLARHKKTHSGERTHPCSVPGCRKVFARKSTLSKHEYTHFKSPGE